MTTQVYSKPNCPYCDRAKALLEKRGVEFEIISAVDNRDALIERVTEITGAPPRTVPQIFLEGQYIGGYDQLVTYFEEKDADE